MIRGRGLQVSGILKIFQTNTATKPTFICVDVFDECVLEHRIVIPEALGQIVKGSLDTWIFVTVRYSLPKDPISGEVTFGLIEPTGDGIVKYCKKLRNDTIPNMMSSTLEATIIERIPQIRPETYVEPPRQKKNTKVTSPES